MKLYVKLLYNEKEKMFEVAKELRLNPFTPSAKNHHRRDLPASSVFTLCGNGIDGERVSASSICGGGKG